MRSNGKVPTRATARAEEWPKRAIAKLSASVTPDREWSPRLAAGLNLVIPGAGQIYKGQIVLGLLWFVLVVAGYMMLVVPGVILQGICVVNAAIGQTGRLAAAEANLRRKI